MVELAILAFSLYFIQIEISQIVRAGLTYFNSIWNLIDLVPPLIQITILVLEINGNLDEFKSKSKEGDPSVELNRQVLATLMSITTLCLWLKFLYFFRIFESTGFLISAILGVIVDMKFFLLILLVALLAFGDSFKVMSLANSGDDQFISGGVAGAFFYSYRVALGDFDTDSFGTVGTLYCIILFILNTLFTTIIMLNLLIAIISEAFEKINQQGKRASYREKAGLIAENLFLIT